MGKLALVTGGTSGIGAAFAKRLASEGYDLILVARNEERLTAKGEELTNAHKVAVDVLPADLSVGEGLSRVEERLRATQNPVDLLVNNAGFGAKGSFLDVSPEQHSAMIAVNVLAVVRLAHAALVPMVARRHGDIINISSVAGFFPGYRSSSTYAATKAFVTALTEGLAPTLVGTGVRVSAVCPGFVRTEFHERAGIPMSNMPDYMWLDADDVVRSALHGHRAGHVITIPGLQYKSLVVAHSIVPTSITRRVTRLVAKLTH